MNNVPREWNLQILGTVYLITFIVSIMLLPCLCNIGYLKSGVITIIFSVIGLRILLAKKRREKNNDWKIYMAFIIASPICIEFLVGH